MNMRNFLGKRCLLKMDKHYRLQVDEFKILEVSPSGNWVKLMNLNGHKFWRSVTDVSFVEELRDFKAERIAEIGNG